MKGVTIAEVHSEVDKAWINSYDAESDEQNRRRSRSLQDQSHDRPIVLSGHIFSAEGITCLAQGAGRKPRYDSSHLSWTLSRNGEAQRQQKCVWILTQVPEGHPAKPGQGRATARWRSLNRSPSQTAIIPKRFRSRPRPSGRKAGYSEAGRGHGGRWIHAIPRTLANF